MDTIDIHAHVLLPGTLNTCGPAGPELTVNDDVQSFRAGDYSIRGVRFADSPMSVPERRFALMQRMGITFQVLSPYPMLFFYDQPNQHAIEFARKHNDEMAALVRQYPAHLGGFATLPMQNPDAAAAELQRAVSELSLMGSYIGSDINGTPLSHPSFEPLWAMHTSLGVPTVIHPGPQKLSSDKAPWDLDLIIGFSMDETSAVAHLVLGGVLDRHPELIAVIPHGGGFAPYVRSRFESAISRRPWGKGLLDRPFSDLWNQLYFDTLIHDAVTLDYLVRAHGAARLLLGTNFAAWDQDDQMIERIAQLAVSPSEKEAILGGNARRLFWTRARPASGNAAPAR